MHIVSIGAGVMSSAFSVAQGACHQVSIISSPFDQRTRSCIEATGFDERLECSWPSSVSFVDEKVVSEFDLIVIGVSSAGMGWAIDIARSLINHKKVPVLLLTKGLQQSGDTLVALPVWVQETLGVDVLAITGPCIAKELAQGCKTSVEISSNQYALAVQWSSLLSLPHYTLCPNEDMIGCQLLAALKNVYAIIIAKAGDHLNHRSSLFAQSLFEMQQWLSDYHADDKNTYGLSGTGDLYVTCLGGRNGKFGHYLSTGLSVTEILEGPMKDVTIEGLDLAMLLAKSPQKVGKTLFLDLLQTLGC